jgi:hypothetical protein
MTPAEEQEFIGLWTQGLEVAEIARRLGIPVGTVSSRAHVLQLQGKIQPRPRGGPHARRVAQARQGGSPVQSAVQGTEQSPDTGAVSSVDTGAVQGFDTGTVQTLGADVEQLKAEVAGLHSLMQSVLDRLKHPPVSTPVQITALPPWPKGEAVRWNLWLPKSIRDELTTWAAEQKIPPSQLVTELLWKALNDRRSSTP